VWELRTLHLSIWGQVFQCSVQTLPATQFFCLDCKFLVTALEQNNKFTFRCETLSSSPHCSVGANAALVSAGAYHTCALLQSSAVLCWGQNFAGQLEIGSTTNVGLSPEAMGSNLTAVDLGPGDAFERFV
jgi:hypothetical protein